MIRAAWNRHLEDSEYPRLWEHLQAQPIAGYDLMTVSARNGKPERIATLAMQFSSVTFGPTQRSKHSLFYPLRPVKLDAVYVTEVNPPDPDNAIEWMLLTNIRQLCRGCFGKAALVSKTLAD